MNIMMDMTAQPTIYKSKIGWALVLPVFIILTSVAVLFVANGLWVMAVLILGLLGAILQLFSSITYTISDGFLHIKAGFLYRIKISIAGIRTIQETSNPISSPAASLDRLAIRYNKWDTVLVSPADKTAFIAHLLEINPGITVQLKKSPAK